MYPLTPKELGSDFMLDKVLRYGSIPLVITQKDRKTALSSYVQMYLKEEIKAEALVRNLSGFARFLPVLALYHGQIINVSATARDAGVSRTTVNGFLEVLEDTLLLEAYETRLKVRERKHPKIYWIDPGIVRMAKKQTGPVTIEEKGSLFEGYIYTCLKVKIEYEKTFDEIYYWSSASSPNIEVDFLLKKNQSFTAIEVKTSKKVHKEHLKGLKAIAEFKSVRQKMLIYLGSQRMRIDGIDIIPFSDFCKSFLTS